ncbi:hypothetical protein [Variovorax boronicumulans]
MTSSALVSPAHTVWPCFTHGVTTDPGIGAATWRRLPADHARTDRLRAFTPLIITVTDPSDAPAAAVAAVVTIDRQAVANCCEAAGPRWATSLQEAPGVVFSNGD